MATGTPVTDWMELPVRYLLTAVKVLEAQAAAAKRAR